MHELIKLNGTVVDDSAERIPIGGVINFAKLLFPFQIQEANSWIKNWNVFEGVLLGVVFSDAEWLYLEGSAVMVGPGIAITAKHVIEARFSGIAEGLENMHCIGITSLGLQMWAVKKVTYCLENDLAMLGLELISAIDEGDTLNQSIITTKVPEIGENVIIYGFKAADNRFQRESICKPYEPMSKPIENMLLFSQGKVTQHFLTQRDSFLMPWPVIEVDCPSWGGMSGGPVFNHEGRLIGLLSSSIETASNDGPSYVSLIYPALTMVFEGGWPAPLFKNPTSLLELDPRACEIEGREALSFVRSEDGKSCHTVYSPFKK